MITFERHGRRFSYRTVGVLLDRQRQRVLLQRAEQDQFWALPGGRVELGEPAEAALRREMQEEVAVEVHVSRLLWVAELFYEYEERHCHELGFYFLMSLPADHQIYRFEEPFFGQEEEPCLIYSWFELADLATTELYPTFLRTRLRALPAHPEYVIHYDPVEP